MWTVIRMNRPACAPVLQSFQRPATILEDLAVHGFDVAVRGQDPNETRYPVNRRAQTLLAFTERLVRTFALGQIEHESDTLILSILEARRADQYGQAAAVFPKILLLELWDTPRQFQLSEGTFVTVAPFRRRQIGSVQATRGEILSVVSHHSEKRVVGITNAAFEIENRDPDNVRVEQASDLPVSLFDIPM